MIVGTNKESKAQECRVALLPHGAGALVARGHTVLVERGAGVAAGWPLKSTSLPAEDTTGIPVDSNPALASDRSPSDRATSGRTSKEPRPSGWMTPSPRPPAPTYRP